MNFRQILREAQNEEKLEQQEKEQRAKNLIIHGMIERADTNGAIKENDTNMVDNILDRIGMTNRPETFVRLGKKTDIKPQTLKIVMKTTSEVKSFMSNLMRLKGTEEQLASLRIIHRMKEKRLKSTSPRQGKKQKKIQTTSIR